MSEQWGIALCGVVAIALTQDPSPSRRRFACLFGLAGQPFWFYAAWQSEQWGIFAICFLYTLSWGKGFYQNWIATGTTTPPVAKEG